MAGEARNHHWIPQCYLKGFAKSRSKNAQLYVIDAYTRKSFLASPRNVASARDFNRVEVDGLNPNHIESRYADFESLVAPALLRMDESGKFGNEDDHNLILNLITLLAVRNPRMRENMRRIQETLVKRVVDLSTATKDRFERSMAGAVRAGHVEPNHGLSYEEMREFVEGDKYVIEIPSTRHVEEELKLVDSILPLLGKRAWLLLRAPQDSGGFISSDHPVCLDWIDRSERGVFSSPGFGVTGTEIVFPVSQRLVMLGTFDGRHGVQDVPAQQVAFLNGFIAAHAHRQIYARDDRFRYAIRTGEQRRGADLLRDLLPAGGAK